MPTRQRPLSSKSLDVLAMISAHGIYAYSPDAFHAPDLPLVAILDDDDRTALPVRSVRALLARDLLRQVDQGHDLSVLEVTDAGRALALEPTAAERS